MSACDEHPSSQKGLVRGGTRGLPKPRVGAAHSLLCFWFLNVLPQKMSLFLSAVL